eukprot:TRINITY_DN15623_c1_g1_i1.p1 TRINITY_DN15623_c1_g1~~TRINITY_DN15623_c1_g1_i1.p1  ORF type:complete len:1994 (+),score=573.06 TRINITY_DN15623_c1_g1_i1:85-6066(+)
MSKVVKEALKQAAQHVKLEEWEQGEQVLRGALKEDPEAAGKHYMLLAVLGKCLHKGGKPGEAEEAYRKAAALDPDNSQAWQGLRDVYLQGNELSKSVEVLGHVARLAATDEQRDVARAKILELIARYDASRLNSASVADYVNKEVAAKQGTPQRLSAAVLAALPAGPAAERLLAQEVVHFERVYRIHPEGDNVLCSAVHEPDGPLAAAAPPDWCVRRGLNIVHRSEDPGERSDLLRRLCAASSSALSRFASGGAGSAQAAAGAIPYWTLRFAITMTLDAPSVWEGDTAAACAHALFGDEPEAQKPEGRLAPNRTEEDMQLAVRQRAAGILLAVGRCVAVLELPNTGAAFELRGGTGEGGAVLRDEAAAVDLEAPLAWLRDGAKECPECIAAHCCEAVLQFRLGRYTAAAAAAERGLGALAYRTAAGSLPAAEQRLWARRLVSARAFSQCLLGRGEQAARSLAVAAQSDVLSGDGELASAAAEVQLHMQRPEEALACLKTGGRRGEAAVVGLHVKARAQAAAGAAEEALKSIKAAILQTKEPRGELYATQAAIQWRLGGEHRPACLESLLKAAELSPTLPVTYTLLGHYHRAEERRADRDGQEYTREQFRECYGGFKEWAAAAPKPRRIDPADGQAYTLAEFQACYGGSAEWEAAQPAAAALPGEVRLARRFYAKAVSLDPLEEEAGRALAAMLHERGETQQLITLCSGIADAAEARGGDTVQRTLWAFRLLGFASLSACRYEQAARCLKQSLRYRPDDPAATCGLARAIEGCGAPARALEQYKRAQAAGAGIEARVGLAACMVSEGRPQEAVRELEAATQAAPDDPAAWTQLARARAAWAQGAPSAQGERCHDAGAVLQQAVAAADRAAQLCGGGANALRFKGEICLLAAEGAAGPAERRAKYLADAEGAFQATIAAPQAPLAAKAHAHYDLARVAFARYAAGGGEKARAAAEGSCRQAIGLVARRAEFWTLLGCVISPDLPNRRLWAFAKALELDPTEFGAWCNQGWVLLMHAQPDPARTSFERAQAIRPDAWQPWLGIGLCLQRRTYGRMTYDAQGAIEQACQRSGLAWLQLVSLVATHFHQPRHYGNIPAFLGPRAEAVAAAFPGDACALNTCGLVFEELGYLQQAAKCYEDALRIAKSPGERDRPNILEWGSGRNGLVAVRFAEAQAWSLCDQPTKRRMLGTSLLRTLCKLGEGGQPQAKEVRKELLGVMTWEDVPYYESTTRAMVCHLLSCSGQEDAKRAESILDEFLPHTDEATHDSLLAALAVHRARKVDEAEASAVAPGLPANSIKDEHMQRLAVLVERLGRALRNPASPLDTEHACTIPEKLMLFKVLLECGAGIPPVRFYDPSDAALIEFRLFLDGSLRYSVEGKWRDPLTDAEFARDAEGAYVEFPCIDACVSLPRGDSTILPRLLRLFAAGGVAHNLARARSLVRRDAEGRPIVVHPEQVDRAAGLLVHVTRDVVEKGMQMTHTDISDAVEVLYRFAGALAAMPHHLPAAMLSDMPVLLHKATAVLQRVSADGAGLSEEKLHKAKYALALLCYAGASAVTGQEQSWEEVLQPDDCAVDAEEEGDGGPRRPADPTGALAEDDTPSFRTPLEGCLEIMGLIAAEGYAEAHTVLGLAHFAAGDYAKATEVLQKTLEDGHRARLDWRRWDARRGLIYSLGLTGDWAGAERALQEAVTRCACLPEEQGVAAAFIAARRCAAAGDAAGAARVAAEAAERWPTQTQPLMDLVTAHLGGDQQEFGAAVRKLKQNVGLRHSGGLWSKNLAASLIAFEVTAMLKRGRDGCVLMQHAPPAAAVSALKRHDDVWPHSVICRQIAAQLGVMRTDPEAAGEAIDSLRRALPGADNLPLLHFWIAHPGVLGRDADLGPGDSLTELLREVASASLSGTAPGDGDGGAHLCGVLRAIVDLGISHWAQMCPPVEQPDPAALRGKEYRDALGRVEGMVRKREAQVRRLRRVVSAALEKLEQLRPGDAFAADRKAVFATKQ